MIGKIDSVQSEFKPKLQKNTLSKIEKLKAKVEGQKDDFDNLNILWKEFVTNKDTLTEAFILAGYYCDKIAQIKSWTIKGHMNSCKEGQRYLDHIDNLQKTENLEYDDELACRVKRLRIKVWDCRYWELVLQARKETHEERERFGPASAGIMRTDLNSDKQP